MNAPIFEMPVAVQSTDIDEQNHVNNTVYLRWVQDVATAHWRALASPEAQRAIGWVVLRHEIDYKIPAALGDEIVLRTWVGAASRLKFERFTEVRRKIDNEAGGSRALWTGKPVKVGEPEGAPTNQLLAKARTIWVPVDWQTGKPTRVPDDVRAQFSI